jgi:hypothetical protein
MKAGPRGRGGCVPGGIDKLIARRDTSFGGSRHQIVTGFKCGELQLINS